MRIKPSAEMSAEEVSELTMVAGLGDEVVAFLVAVVFGAVLLLAWMSSNVRERPRVEAVLVQQVRPGVVVAGEISRDDALHLERRQQEGEHEDARRGEGSGAIPSLQNAKIPKGLTALRVTLCR